MEDRRRYKNPPIEEALCEFKFEPSVEWDYTIPGKLHTRLLEDYPGKPQWQKLLEFSWPIAGRQPASMSRNDEFGRVQLLTQDAKRIVGVGPDVLSIHMLRPYQDPRQPDRSGWDEFYPRLEKALTSYWEIAEPKGVNQIGIRYINKIVIPGPVDIEEYLRCSPREIEGLPDNIRGFFSRIEYIYDDETYLALSQGSVDAPYNDVALLLDLDVIWEPIEVATQEYSMTKTQALRSLEREAFESVITDKARELFDAD